jgi:sec-independent protein translocase protein TatC
LSQDQIGNKPDEEMSFLAHLEQLRWHLVRSVIAIFSFAIIAFLFKNILFDKIIFGPMKGDFITYRWLCWLSETLSLGDAICFGAVNERLQSIAVVTQFTIHILGSVIAGFILAFPYVFNQIWRFIVPALKDKEQKSARGMTIWVSLMFMFGVLFGYFLLVPISVQFFVNYSVSDVVSNNFTINSYVSLITSLTMATGLLFQLPIVMYVLTRIGLVSPEILKKYRRHIIVVVVVLAAIITPPDVTSQILVAIPILVLYEVGIWISRRTLKRMNKKRKAEL